MTKKFKVQYTTIFHNKKLYKEGDIIENLTDDEAARLADFLKPVPESKTTKNSAKSNKIQEKGDVKNEQ